MPMLAAAGVALAGTVYSGLQGAKTAENERDAAAAAQDKQMAAVEEERRRQMKAAGQANSLLQQGSAQGQDQLRQSMGAAQDFTRQGFSQGRADLGQYYGQGRADMQAGEQSAMQRLGAGIGAARSDMLAGQAQAGNTMERAIAGGNLQALMNGGLQSGFEADPGYQFRQQQGEQALARRAAASGGRLGGGALKSLMEFNSGLASQEYGNYAQRAIGMAGQEDARRSNLLGQLSQQQYGGGQNLGQLMMQGGLTGASYGMGLGQGLGGYAMQQGSNLSNLATGQGSALAGLEMQGGNNLAQMMFGSAQQQGANLLGGAGATVGLTNNMMQQYNNPVAYAGAQNAAYGQMGAAAAQNISQGLAAYGMYNRGQAAPAYGDQAGGGYKPDPNATWVQGS
jgi:hypothetical protein